MAEESNTLRLYNSLRDNGYKLPEYDRFEGRLKDSAARETLYNTLRDNGVNDLPEFSAFETWLGYPMPEDLKEDSSQLPAASEEQILQQPPQNPAKQQTGFLGTFVGDVLERINAGGAELGAGIFGVLDKGAKGLENLTGGLIQSKGAWRDVADKFKQDATVSRANSNRYDGKSYSDLWKEGDYLGAIGDIALTGAESIPMSIAAAAASVANPAAGLVGIGGITASERYDELSEENPNMAEFPKIANAILTGVAEGGSEMLGAGATNLWMQGLYKTLGRERAEQAVKEGFMGKLRQHFKDFGIFYEPVVEGLEEVSSQLAQNVTDKITGAAPDKDISEGLMDSFIYGMGGGAYFSAAGVPGFIKQRVERRKALQAGKEMPESDYNSAYQSSEQSRQSLSDIDPNLAATIDRYVNDESSPGEVQSLFDGLDETVRPLAEAYYQSQLVMRGITERNLDDAESEVQAFADRIAPFTVKQDDGRRLITTAHFSEGLTEKDVYVKTIEGDNAVIFNDDGTTRMVSAKRLQNIQEQDADDLIARYRENALDGKNTQMEFRLHHHPKTQPAQPGLVIFNGDKAYILQERDERGDWVAFPAVLDTETGQTTAKKGGEPSILTDAEVLELQDLMYAAQEPENQANEETEKTPNISAKTPNVSDETLGEISGTSGAVQNLLDVDANQPKTENATSSRIPMDAEGNPQYHLADINDTLDDLLDGSLSIEEVDGLVSANRKDAEKRLADIDKKRPSIGRSKAEYLRQRADWQATRDEVQQELDYWNEVDNQLKESRQQSGEDAALAVLKNQTPQTGEELAAEMLADGSIKLLRDDYMRETGGGRGEARGLFGLFAGRDKGGLTVEQAGEILMQADLEQGTNLFDQTDPNAGRNAIIDVLSEARTRGDLINYVRRSREEQARRAAEAEYNEYARWCEENFGMSPEDYEAYIEATERDFRGKMQTPEAFAIVDGEIYDAMLAEQQEYADIDAILEQSNEIENEDTERNDEGRGSSLREGGGEILPGTQPVEAGGTGDVEGIRQAGSDVDSADGTAQAEGRGEIDENGHPFVLASDGTTVFGQITANTGLAEAPIKLSEGFQSEDGKGYGLAHIENRHGNQIRNAGFSSIEDFVETVAKNFSIIRKGNDRGKNETFLLEVQDKHNNTLFIELSKDGSYWNVNSAGVFKKSYSKKKDVVWTLPAVGSSTSADATEVNNGTIEGATVTSGDSSQTTSSEGKDTDIPAQNQVSAPEFIPGESFFDMAERQKAANDRRAEEQKVDTNPTPAQKEAGNYKKGHIKLDGFDITIENPKGSTRSGVDANGNPWSVTMNNSYGYIRGTEGVDGDHIDVFLSDDPTQGDVFVIDQVKADGTFDEHKVMYGFKSALAAKRAYLANYSEGWQGLGTIARVSRDDFKKWVKSSHRKTKPFAEYKGVENKESSNPRGNRLVTDERYAELRRRMQEKLRGQMNMGIDPEILAIGTEMAVYHIEKGARQFANYARGMIADLGDAIRPYLKAFYNGARDLPEMSELSKEMDSYDDVSRFDVANFDKPVPNMMATAETIVEEQKVEKQAKEARRKIKNSRKKVSANEDKDVPLSSNDLFTFNNNVNDGSGNQRTNPEVGEGAREEVERPQRRGNRGSLHGDNVPDADGSGRVPVSNGNVEPAVTPAARNKNNFAFGDNHIDVPAGEVGKLKANIEAIRTLKEVEDSGKPATDEQKAKLVRYVGWGGLSESLNEEKYNRRDNNWYKDRNWNDKYLPYYEELKGLLSEDEFRSALMSTTTSHYTPEPVIRSLWNIAQQLGFKGGYISEPAMGVGHILGLMPKDISDVSRISGYEIDSLSGRISKALYPDADVKVEGYETSFSPKSKDLVITNVPFGRDAPYDKALDRSLRKRLGASYNLHNYFIAKGLLELKDGGLGVFVTSSATMDGADSRFREFVQGNGFDLVGAIRLPNDAFLKNAGTSVTADILVFRRRMPGENSNGVNFVGTTQIGEGSYLENGEERTKPIMVNEYFAEHPEMMLGEMMTAHDAGSGGLYSGASQTLKARAGENLSEALNKAIDTLPKDILDSQPAVSSVEPAQNTSAKDGTLSVQNGKVYVSMSGQLEPIAAKETFTYNGKEQKTADAVRSYNDLKDTLKELIAAEQSTETDPEPLRKKLNQQYDAFVRNYGTLNRNKALDSVFAEDFEHNLPLSLESVQRVPSPTGKSMVYQVTKGQGILSKRVNFPTEEPAKAGSLQDAMNISRSYHGRIDVPYIAKLRNMSEEEVVDEMLREGAAYRDPITGDLVDKDTYLSGNVKEKLEEARTAAEENPAFEKNVEDLAAVQPETIRFGDISYRLGTPWIPTGFVDQFASEVLGISDTWIRFVPQLNEFILDKSARIGDYAKSGAFETERLGAIDLFEAALNQRKPKVYDERTEYGPTGKTKVRILNEAETQAAAEKIMEISDRFVEYIDGKKAIHRELERIYNDRYNNYRLKEYGLPSFEHYPNSNHDITLRKHQMKAVQRSLGESTLLAHQVGTGKTFTMITTAMEMRRLGIAKKPMIVVQNATLEDFVKDFYKLYPGANVLAPGKDERSAENRKRLFNLIATGDFDAIVIPQSFMQFIPDDEGRKKALIQQRIDEFQRVIDATDDNTLKRRLQKEMDNLKDDFDGVEKSKKRSVKDKAKSASRMKSRLERQLDRRTDDVLTFEQMGIDALFIDEAHNFKKIGFPSKMSNVKGIDTGASQRANSLLLKAKWVQEKNGGRNVILATGTPITNTMAEVWTMMNFVSPDILEAYNIQNFDDFATTFGVVEPSLEFTATGNFKIADRFKSYVNVPELIKAFRSHTDVVLTTDVEEFKKAKNIPKLKDGQITNVVIDKNEDLQDVMDVLIKRLEEYNNMTGSQKREMSALPLVVFTKAKQAAIDLRLLNPTYPDNPNSKTNQVVSNIMKLYKESTPDKGTQLVFCDSYQSPGEMPKMDLFDYDPSVPRFNLYEDIKQKLVEQGIPAGEIAIVNNYDGERRKALFEKVRNGDVRVLLGSTEKMGVGVNVQDRLYALHHIDAPLRPMDFEQRNGRILRQGNLYATWDKPVNVITYGVQGTLDATAYDRLRIKQDFINQMMKGNVEGRVMEEQDDEDPSGMSFSQMAATLSGDKTAQMLFIAQNKLKKLRNSKRSDANSKSGMSDTIENTKRLIRSQEGQKESLEKSKAIIDKYFPNGIEHIKIGKNSINEKFGTQLDPIITDYDEKYSLNRGIAPLKLSLNGGNAEAIVHFNEGRMVYDLFAGKEHLVENRQFNGGRGLMASLEHQLEAVDKNLNTLTEYIEANRKKIDGLTEAMNKPWGREDELKAAEKKVAELQRQLEEKAKAKDNPKPQEQKEELPEVRFRMKSIEELLDNINNNADEYREGNTAPQIPRPEANRANLGIGPFEYPNDNLGRPEHAEPRGGQDAGDREADGGPQPGTGRDDSQNGTDNGRRITDARREDRRAGGRNHAAAGLAGEQPRREDRRGWQRSTSNDTEPEGDNRVAGADNRRPSSDNRGFGGTAGERRERAGRAAVEAGERLGQRVQIIRSPGEVTDRVARQEIANGRRVTGWYDIPSRTIYIYLPNVANESEAVKTVLHETVGHKGLRQLLGEQDYDAAMMRLYGQLPLSERQKVADKAMLDYGGDFAVAMDEYLAEQAERDETPSWWNRVKSAVRDMLRSLGLNVELSDNDVKYLLWRSKTQLENRNAFNVAEDLQMRRKLGIDDSTVRFRTAKEEVEQSAPSGESMVKAWDRLMSSDWFKMKEALYDYLLSVEKFQKLVAQKTKSKILDFENAYWSLLAVSSRNKDEFDRLESKFIPELNNAIRSLVGQVKGKWDWSKGPLRDLVMYVEAKHGIERNRDLAVRKGIESLAKEPLSRFVKAGIVSEQEVDAFRKEAERKAKERAEKKASESQKKLVEQATLEKEERDFKHNCMKQLYKKWEDAKHDLFQQQIPWEEKQARLDEAAREFQWKDDGGNFGAVFGNDYSGLSSVFKPEGEDSNARNTEWDRLAHEYVKKYEQEHEASAIDNLWTSIKNLSEYSLRKQNETGLINKEYLQNNLGRFEYFIPLRGFEDTTAGEVYDYIYNNEIRAGSPVKAMEGRSSEAANPFGGLLSVAYSSITSGNKNLAKQKFLNLIRNHDTEGLATVSDVWIRNVGTKEEEDWVEVAPEIKENASPDEVAQAMNDFEEKMKALQEEGLALKTKGGHSDIPYRTLGGQRNEHQVQVLVGGNRYIITINGNPRVAQALNGLTNPDVDESGMWAYGKKVQQFMAGAFTSYNPAFSLANLSRDTGYSSNMVFINEDVKYWKEFLKNQKAGFFELPKMASFLRAYREGNIDNLKGNDAKLFKEFMMNGGATGYTFIENQKEYAEKLVEQMKELSKGNLSNMSPRKWLKLMFDSFEFMGNAAELVNRFAVYKTSRSVGRSIARSINDAKEVTINFSRKGAGRKTYDPKNKWYVNLAAAISQFGRQYILFWNASLQGKVKLFKSAMNHPVKALPSFVGGAAGIGMMLPFLNNMFLPMLYQMFGVGGDDDDKEDYYDVLSDYDREKNICLRLPGGGYWLKIPVSPDMSIFMGLGDKIAGNILGKREIDITDGVKAMADVTSPIGLNWNYEGTAFALNAFPTVVQPVMQTMMNVNFMGSPIKKESINRAKAFDPEYTKVYRSASSSLVELSKLSNNLSGGDAVKAGMIDWNPAVLQNFINGYTGGFGSVLIGMADMVVDASKGEKAEVAVSRYPLVSRFLSGGDIEVKKRRVNANYQSKVVDFVNETEHRYKGYERMIADPKITDFDRAEYMVKYNELTNTKDFKKYFELKSYIDAIKDYEKWLKDFGANDDIENQLYELKLRALEILDKKE